MTIYNLMMIALIFGIALMFGDLLYVLVQKPSPLQSHIIILCISTILMFVGYFVEIKAQTQEAALLGAAVSYLGKPFIMLSAFMFVCEFYGIKIHRVILYILATLCACYFVIVYTTPITHLYYSTIEFDETLRYSKLVLGHGPLYSTYICLTVVFFFSCIYCIITGFLKNKSKESGYYAFFLSMMVISGIVGYVIYLTNRTNGYDTTVLGVFFGSIFLSLLFFKYRIFDIVNIAKDEALEKSSTGLIIFDFNNVLVYANEFAKELLETKIDQDELVKINVNESKLMSGQSVYAITRRDIVTHGNGNGKSYEISDITETYSYQNRLESEVLERTERIESIQRKVVGSFASIVEARSIETGEHIIRTSEYVNLVANQLRNLGLFSDVLTREYVELLTEAAPLHDVGKISVPDGILLKPGKLTTEEFEKMKIHTEIGAQIIEATMKGVESDEYVSLAYEIAKYHHERWDGTGYPTGLKGEEIPLSARIMAIADCFDALVSERCYKPPYTIEESINIIKEESGTHFDPTVVNAFVSAMEKNK